jgi:son of sevenless-like protein
MIVFSLNLHSENKLNFMDYFVSKCIGFTVAILISVLFSVYCTEGNQVMVLVWDEVTETHVVAAGTVEHLVEHLANEDRPDPGYVKTFLMGYRHFMAAKDLIDQLLAKFNVGLPEESTDEEKEYVEKWGVVVQLRTVDVLTQWMERCWFDFHEKQAMLTRVDDFIEELRSNSDNEVFKALAETLKKVKDKKTEEETMKLEAVKLMKPLEPSPLTFDDFTAQQLAKHLTLTELFYLKAIEPTEFIRQLWDKHPGTKEEKKRALTPNISEYVDFFNRVCFWVGTEVLSSQDVKVRSACVEKMIEIARLCRSYNNFNTSMAIMTGLNYSAVGARRLKQTWEQVSVRSRTTLEDIEELFSSESNFITYRRLQGGLKRTAPCIPFFGLYSKDFVFINDGNPKRLANGLVNFSKLRMVMHRVSDLEWYQHSRFQFASEVNADHIHYCKTLRALSDEELYERSLLVEPKVRSTPSDESSKGAVE